MPDALFSLSTHPRAVPPYIFRQPLRPRPVRVQYDLLFPRRQRPDRFVSGKARRDFNHCLVDGDGHGVQIAGPGFQSQPLGFQRQRAAPGKGIVKPWERGHPARMDGFNNLVV